MDIESLGNLHPIDGNWTVIGGPCSAESRDQIINTAKAVAESGAHVLRAGIWKPRTRPDSWQGAREEALEWMKEAKHETGIAIATEVNSPDTITAALRSEFDILWIGTRSATHFPLLTEAGRLTSDTKIPVILKRGMGSDLNDWLGAADYIRKHNPNVILCERGIQGFSKETRYTLDLQIAKLAQLTSGLPVVIDVSHAAGRRDLIVPMALAVKAAGFNGLMVEIHPDPDQAKTDSKQQISLSDFSKLMRKLDTIPFDSGRRPQIIPANSIVFYHPQEEDFFQTVELLQTYVSQEDVPHVFVQEGIFSKIAKWVQNQNQVSLKMGRPESQIVVLTDERVVSIYGQTFLQKLTDVGLPTKLITVPANESSKSVEVWQKVTDQMLEDGYDRNTMLIALGGGMVGDLAGFVASTYKRGIPLIQVPTTLLAQVDSSIGGKAAVNTDNGKNMIGTFKLPMATFVDPELLRTLPNREIVSGLGEIIKYGAIDAETFDYIESNLDALLEGDTAVLTTIIKRCLAIKSEFVQADPEDHDVRQVLNFGHTIGQAIEVASDYNLTHGEAISIGMAYEAELGVKEGCWTTDEKLRFIKLLQKAGLPTEIPNSIAIERIIASIKSDKKGTGQKIKFAIPMGISSSMLEGFHTAEISEEEVRSLLQPLVV